MTCDQARMLTRLAMMKRAVRKYIELRIEYLLADVAVCLFGFELKMMASEKSRALYSTAPGKGEYGLGLSYYPDTGVTVIALSNLNGPGRTKSSTPRSPLILPRSPEVRR